jgi:hypothetical protein
MSDLLQVKASLAESKTDYDKWMAANKTAIQDIRTTYALDAAQGRSKLLALLDKTNSVVPVLLQQTLRTGVIYQLIGAPNATLRITLCPVCRELFELLNGRIHILYSNKR